MTEQSDILARLDRLESREEIRQLASKYALALDMRDMDAMAGLFPEDVAAGKGRTGRQALRDWLSETMRKQFDGTSHHVGTQIIEFIDADTAEGIVYSKNEHETGAEWVIMQMMYHDRYERIAGRWYFRRRVPLYWYATDLNKPPIGQRKMRWPGREPYSGSWHDLFPSWRAFWDAQPEGSPAVPEPAPLEEFIKTMRKGNDVHSVRVR
ncbi:nuclear transport factor 2 family protein [Oceanibium sediminis]|uniref:nuclear transport factor 2 family protein n=1 Tax=Oceanibium sediminis TaxID=2026339 RepID=UPI000DD4A554|nr:nuclear transport factor 2 family protein [Oceanibium sediminis]